MNNPPFFIGLIYVDRPAVYSNGLRSKLPRTDTESLKRIDMDLSISWIQIISER
ncbi:MAG: hypothetical protein KUG83_10250 [Gammaproteobacteria bacterium]|nr:hypothetical protein [Gammaproteobacteria bacterium]